MNKLTYSQPASQWTEALPLGNGRMGAMHFGGVEQDQFQLNEDTLWSGPPTPMEPADHRELLENIRRLIDNQQYEKANEETKKLFGSYTESYLPFGNIYLRYFHGDVASHYQRTLDLETAISAVDYQVGNVTYTREAFISYPQQVLAVHLTSSESQKLDLAISMDSPLLAEKGELEDQLFLQGICPEVCLPSYFDKGTDPIVYGEPGKTKAIHFEGRLGLKTADGIIKTVGGELLVEGATTVTLYLSIQTSFKGFDQLPGRSYADLTAKNQALVEAAMELSYEELKALHIQDYQELFKRVDFTLHSKSGRAEKLDTDDKVRQRGAADDGLIELLFQYGRYLLIASSRPGSQPANLQGIWNPHTRAPWSSNYTLNINTPMNYWPAEVTNLSECHEPLLQMVQELFVSGEKMVDDWYGMDGWTAHHNTDLWRHTHPTGDRDTQHGDPAWAYWPMSGPWLTRHLWEHYVYTQDEAYLRKEAFPILKESAFFCLNWLIEEESGYLITSPSTSPEHVFIYEEQAGGVTKGATMDLQIIWDLFTIVLEAADILAIEADWLEKVVEVKAKLHPMQIGKEGQLQEWLYDYEDSEPEHRHVSHLYGLYPGNQLFEPSLLEASRKTLNIRGDDGTGWSLGWKMNLWARLKDGDRIESLIQKLFHIVDDSDMSVVGGGLYPNLLGAHPPFQIDGNFSFTAGVAEMLIQSHERAIELLPALPTSWENGSITGLRARGGHEINLSWKNNRVEKIELLNLGNQAIVLKTEETFSVQNDAGEQKILKSENGYITIHLAKKQRITLMNQFGG